MIRRRSRTIDINNSVKRLKYRFKKALKTSTEILLAGIAYFLFYFIRFLVPIRISSSIGYLIGISVLYYFPFQRRKEVLGNIAKAFPKNSRAKNLKIYRGSCGNFLQVVFELPKAKSLLNNPKYVKITDEAGILQHLGKKKFLIFTSHMGNWQVAGLPFVFHNTSHSIYKTPNNKYISRLLKSAMLHDNNNYKHKMITLNKSVVLSLNQQLKNNPITLLMLIDQRIKEGLNNVTFFGRKALTSHFLPMLSLKYEVPLIPLRIIRNPIWGSKPMFEFILEDPLKLERSGDNKEDIRNLTQMMNIKIESWVRQYPSQWFWLHRRW